MGVVLKNVSASILKICIWQRVGQTNTWHCKSVWKKYFFFYKILKIALHVCACLYDLS